MDEIQVVCSNDKGLWGRHFAIEHSFWLILVHMSHAAKPESRFTTLDDDEELIKAIALVEYAKRYILSTNVKALLDRPEIVWPQIQ